MVESIFHKKQIQDKQKPYVCTSEMSLLHLKERAFVTSVEVR